MGSVVKTNQHDREIEAMQRLSRDEQRGLRRLRKRGRAGATALELGESERAGLQLGARLVKLGLATVTRTNRFLLTKHLRTSVPAAITWELANPMAYARRHDQDEREPRRIGRVPSRNESVADTTINPLLGPPCPRCREATQVRKHAKIGSKQLRQPFYYRWWFCCVNKNCRTKLIMPPEAKVWNNGGASSERAR
jgi:hypothetical protein